MRWTKVRKLVHDSFADSVRGRVKVDVTNVGPRGMWRSFRCNCNRGTISVDRRIMALFNPHHFRRLSVMLPRQEEPMLWIEPAFPSQKIPAGLQVGRFMDLTEACWQYLHSSVNDSLRSPDPFVSTLAILNAKVGPTRLKRAMTWDLHPLTRAMLDFRLQAERDGRASAIAAA